MMGIRHNLMSGALKLIQPDVGEGLRMNVDTVLLADFVRPKVSEKILEIGCAHGSISLILAKRGFSVVGIDIQPHLIELAKKNAELNALSAEFCVADIRDYKKIAHAQSFDRIVVNPPYDEPGRSCPSPRGPVSAAMHGSCCTLGDIVTASRFLLKNRGRLDMVMRADRMGELFAMLDRANIQPKRLRCIYSKPAIPAFCVLIEAMRAGRHGLVVEPPFFITDENGVETRELKEAYVIREGR